MPDSSKEDKLQTLRMKIIRSTSPKMPLDDVDVVMGIIQQYVDEATASRGFIGHGGRPMYTEQEYLAYGIKKRVEESQFWLDQAKEALANRSLEGMIYSQTVIDVAEERIASFTALKEEEIE